MKRFRKDDRGIAMVSVLVMILLCFLLSATIMRASYVALLSRNVNTASANTFYSAESVVDDIKIKLQTVAAYALDVAGAEDSEAFINAAYTQLTGGKTGPQAVQYAQEYLNTAVFDVEALNAGAKIVIGEFDESGVRTKYDQIQKSKDENGNWVLVITNVHITYVNPETGYTSEITTSIRINAPFYASSVKNSLGSYSILVGSGAEFSSSMGIDSHKSGYMVQKGNVYFGTMAGEGVTDALKINDNATLDMAGDNVVINGDIHVGKHGTVKFTGAGAVEIRGTVYLDAGANFVISDKTYVLCKDIVVEGKSVSGNTSTTNRYYNSTSGQAYSRYLPYAKDPTDYSWFSSTGDSTARDDLGIVNSNSAKLLILDTSKDKCYQLCTDGTNFWYNLESGTKVDFDLVSGTTNISANKGIYFDSTIKIVEKVPYKSKSGTSYDIDDQVYRFLNVAYLTYLGEKGTASREVHYKTDDYTEVVAADPLGLGATKKDGQKSYYRNTSLISDGDLPTLSYAGKMYGGNGPDRNKMVVALGKVEENLNNNSPKNSSNMFMYFCINAYKVPFNCCESYIGIYMSLEKVTYALQEGGSTGKSILDSSNTNDVTNAKTYMKELSKYICGQSDWATSNSGANAYGLMINNMFNGGWESFFDDENQTSTSVDTSVNEKLDLIEIDGWEKH